MRKLSWKSSRWILALVISVVGCAGSQDSKPASDSKSVAVSGGPAGNQELKGGANTAESDPALVARHKLAEFEAEPITGCNRRGAYFPAIFDEYLQLKKRQMNGDQTAEAPAGECLTLLTKALMQQGINQHRPRSVSSGTQTCHAWRKELLGIAGIASELTYRMSERANIDELAQQFALQGSYEENLQRIDSCSEEYPDAVAELSKSLQEDWEFRFLNRFISDSAHGRELRESADYFALRTALAIAYTGAILKGSLGTSSTGSAMGLFRKFADWVGRFWFPVSTGSFVAVHTGAPSIDKMVQNFHNRNDKNYLKNVPLPPAYLLRLGQPYEYGLIDQVLQASQRQKTYEDINGYSAGFMASFATGIRVGVIGFNRSAKVVNAVSTPAKEIPHVLIGAAVMVVAGEVAEWGGRKGSRALDKWTRESFLREKLAESANQVIEASKAGEAKKGEMFIAARQLIDRAVIAEMTALTPVLEAQIQQESEQSSIEWKCQSADRAFSSDRSARIDEALKEIPDGPDKEKITQPDPNVPVSRWIRGLPIAKEKKQKMAREALKVDIAFAQMNGDCKAELRTIAEEFKTNARAAIRFSGWKASPEAMDLLVNQELVEGMKAAIKAMRASAPKPTAPEATTAQATAAQPPAEQSQIEQAPAPTLVSLVEGVSLNWTDAGKASAISRVREFVAETKIENESPLAPVEFIRWLTGREGADDEKRVASIQSGKADLDPSEVLLGALAVIRKADPTLRDTYSKTIFNRIRYHQTLEALRTGPEGNP